MVLLRYRVSGQFFRWSVRVYYEDTDAGGVVYHARYLAFYERARTEILRQHHFYQQQLLHTNGIAFVVRRMTINYRMPARLDDMLDIQSNVTLMRKTALTFVQRILDARGNILSDADVLVVCVNPCKLKPVALPESMIAAFKR